MGQDQGSIQVSQLQGPAYARLLNLDFGKLAADKSAHWFLQQNAAGQSLSNYSVYVVLNPDSSSMQLCDVSHDYIDAERSSSTCVIPPDPPSADQISKVNVDQFVKVATLQLIKPLHAGAHYIFTIRDSSSEKLDIPFSNSVSIITPDQSHLRSVLKVKSAVNLRTSEGQSVTVSRSVAKGPSIGAETYPATVRHVNDTTDGVELVLQKELPSGKANPLQLEVKGLTDNYGSAVKIQTKIQGAPGAPSVPASPGASSASTNISNAFVTTQLSAIAAVHSSPTFSGTGAIAPWHPPTRIIWLPGGIFLDPAVTFDVGSANAKSTNSVIIPSQFSHSFIWGLPTAGDQTTGNPIAANTTFGPRAEFDTLYGGVNLLGEGRLELYLRQLSQSVDVQKAVISAGNPAIKDLLELPGNGYSVFPYVQFDAGGHLNSQSISNPQGDPPTDIPTYNIARVYLGIHGTAQVLQRNNFTIDASYVDLFSTETVPYTVNKVVFARSLSGFQPHAKLTYSFTFDEAKHFAGSIAWENGRSAPTFQYLNKVTVGLQVTY
jgi:hypothetical protein